MTTGTTYWSGGPVAIIIRNSAKCLKCNDEIESTYRHDSQWCSCGNVMVDGGHTYFRRAVAESEYYLDTSYIEEKFDEAE